MFALESISQSDLTAVATHDILSLYQEKADRITIPMVVEKSGTGERAYDIFSRLVKSRIILLGNEIDEEEANIIMAQLLYMESNDPDKEICMYINSPGGLITSGLAIYDTMQYIKAPISTICMGEASSMGAYLLAAGAPGRRMALANAQIMLHQPLGGATGKASDIEIQANEINRLKSRLNALLAFHCNRDIKQIEADTERDFYMSAEQALEYGLIDQVLAPKAHI